MVWELYQISRKTVKWFKDEVGDTQTYVDIVMISQVCFFNGIKLP